MKIALRANDRSPLRWHADLAARLDAAGHSVRFESLDSGQDPLSALHRLVWFEKAVFGRVIPALEPAERPIQPGFDDEADLVVDLSGESVEPSDSVTLQPAFEGRVHWMALHQALLDERSPALTVVRRPGHVVVAQGLAAAPQPALFSTSLDAVLRRLALLLASAVGATGERRGEPEAPGATAALSSPLVFGAAHIARSVERKLRKLVEHPAHWRIGWRRPAAGDSLVDTLAWPSQTYEFLDPGPGVYAADPFVMTHGGQVHVFCEVLEYASPRGKIAVFTLDAQGRPGPLRTVLERPYHISYPVVFERDGEIWMIPETHENRTVELYRAKRFPDEWVLEGEIFSDVALSDVTLVEHDGRFWMFAADTAGGATTWDTLSLFMADDWRGPWTPHPLNPVLVDAQAARPAGGFLRHGGALIRPAQDCRAGYGAGLSICRVDRLDPEGFEQTILTTLGPIGPRDTGVHTLSVGGGFELIDACGPKRRW